MEAKETWWAVHPHWESRTGSPLRLLVDPLQQLHFKLQFLSVTWSPLSSVISLCVSGWTLKCIAPIPWYLLVQQQPVWMWDFRPFLISQLAEWGHRGCGETAWEKGCWNNADVCWFQKWPKSQLSCHLTLSGTQCRGQARDRGWAPNIFRGRSPSFSGQRPPMLRPQMEESLPRPCPQSDSFPFPSPLSKLLLQTSEAATTEPI